MTNTYYCVTSTYYDDGSVIAAITDMIINRRKPANFFKTCTRYDVYNDWFETYAAAVEFCNQVNSEGA